MIINVENIPLEDTLSVFATVALKMTHMVVLTLATIPIGSSHKFVSLSARPQCFRMISIRPLSRTWSTLCLVHPPSAVCASYPTTHTVFWVFQQEPPFTEPPVIKSLLEDAMHMLPKLQAFFLSFDTKKMSGAAQRTGSPDKNFSSPFKAYDGSILP